MARRTVPAEKDDWNMIKIIIQPNSIDQRPEKSRGYLRKVQVSAPGPTAASATVNI